MLWGQWYNRNHKFDQADEKRIIRSHSWDHLERLVWDKTKKKDVLAAWVERNIDWLSKNTMKFVAVNPYVGMTMMSSSGDELRDELSALPFDIRKDMVVFFNSNSISLGDANVDEGLSLHK